MIVLENRRSALYFFWFTQAQILLLFPLAHSEVKSHVETFCSCFHH